MFYRLSLFVRTGRGSDTPRPLKAASAHRTTYNWRMECHKCKTANSDTAQFCTLPCDAALQMPFVRGDAEARRDVR